MYIFIFICLGEPFVSVSPSRPRPHNSGAQQINAPQVGYMSA